MENEAKYTQNVDEIENAIQMNAERGHPEHMWAQLAPETQHQNQQDMNESIDVETTLEQEDVDANDR